MAPGKRRKGKQAVPAQPVRRAAAQLPVQDNVVTSKKELPHEPPAASTPTTELQMVLTSEKRRGVYHCDYCHADISQMPRIRCAVCPDFDLCLDCFANTDHSAVIAGLKAAAAAQQAEDGSSHGSMGLSTAAVHHDCSHGYRVADSTRYALFPSTRTVAPSQPPSCVDDKSVTGEVEKMEDDEEAQALELDEKQEEAEAPVEPSEPETEKEGSGTLDGQVVTTGTGNVDSSTVPTPPHSEQSSGLADAAADGAAENTDADNESVLVVQEGSKSFWTAEEDLRLLDAISSFGLGNWADISEAVNGPGSSGKTAKRCMERYIDDFLGRYGHILPPYMFVDEDAVSDEREKDEAENELEDGDTRAGKRRLTERSLLRSQSSVSIASQAGSRGRKRMKTIVPTSFTDGYERLWPSPYLPPIDGAEVGREVGRDASIRAEQAYVKAISQAPTKEEAEKMRQEWMEMRLNQINGPTVLPPRPEDIPTMPGSELAGYMPRREEFDMEWDNDAEAILADMEFSPNDPPQDRELKIQVIEIYNKKLDERERRKKFLLSRNLLDYRKNQQADLAIPSDERDLIRRMRLFERLHTPEEHDQFLADILKAKRLRKEIAKLQMYRRMGIKSLAEAEKFELDKNRREYHKMAQLQRDASGIKGSGSASSTNGGAPDHQSSLLWKQYKPSDRKSRRLEQGAVGGDSMAQVSSIQGSSADADVGENEKNGVEKTIEPDLASQNEVGFAISNAPCYELLSVKEVELCRKLHLLPKSYIDVKTAIIQESLQQGLLDNESSGSSRRAIVKIDAQRRQGVVDFMVKAGWVSSKLASGALSRVALD